MEVRFKPKRFEWNPAKIVDAKNKAAYKLYTRMGYRAMLDARQSIRSPGKKGKPSKPGTPPKNRTGILKAFIFYAYDSRALSVTMGTTLAGRTQGKAPRTLEVGGPVKTPDGKPGYVHARPFIKPAGDKQSQKHSLAWKNAVTR